MLDGLADQLTDEVAPHVELRECVVSTVIDRGSFIVFIMRSRGRSAAIRPPSSPRICLSLPAFP